jgi:hypothetical protein
LTLGLKNVIQQPLVDCAKVLLPPFHVKPGVMILFVWALDKDGYWFQYICLKFCIVTHDKLKAGVCTSPHILNSWVDHFFKILWIIFEKQAWQSFKNMVDDCLENTRRPSCKDVVQNLLDHFRILECGVNKICRKHQ